MAGKESEPVTVDRKSERELVVTRTFNAPARLVFEAWTNPDLFQRWWVPKSAPISLVSCEMDIRTGADTAWSSPTGIQPWPSSASISK